jgi:2,3-bisphosphoglycerate-independent phosphoglycerate mutase
MRRTGGADPLSDWGAWLKYVVLIVDGASGWPVASLAGRTALEAAHTPNLDRLAQEGTAGLADNVPEGMEASSAIACMSVMGFDPALYYVGRGPIEAAAMGVELDIGQVAMRLNLVTVLDGRMVSYSAGNISSAEAAELVDALREELGDERLEFHAGVGFRHILTVRDGAALVTTDFVPPHDVTDKLVDGYGPQGPGATLVFDLTERSKGVLADHPVNKARVARGQAPATQIWLFWPGMKPELVPSFSAANGGLTAVLTSGVDLLRGLAIQAGVDLVDIPGVTDDGDNDYAGQMAGALAALEDHDVAFVHVEAPDEAAHAGDARGKVQAIEQVDALMVPQLLDGAFAQRYAWAGAHEVRLLVLPDHPTPLELKTHVAEPVPFVMWGPGFGPNGAGAYTEKAARATGFAVAPGHLLLSKFLGWL